MIAVSLRRATIAMGFNETSEYTQHDVSLAKRWFGSGGSRKPFSFQ